MIHILFTLYMPTPPILVTRQILWRGLPPYYKGTPPNNPPLHLISDCCLITNWWTPQKIALATGIKLKTVLYKRKKLFSYARQSTKHVLRPDQVTAVHSTVNVLHFKVNGQKQRCSWGMHGGGGGRIRSQCPQRISCRHDTIQRTIIVKGVNTIMLLFRRKKSRCNKMKN